MSFKILSPNVLDFCKILKINKKNVKSAIEPKLKTIIEDGPVEIRLKYSKKSVKVFVFLSNVLFGLRSTSGLSPIVSMTLDTKTSGWVSV